MLAGAMFFGREASGDGGSELQIGPVQVGTKALYISFVSALIVMPVNVAIAFLFKRSRPKPEQADRTVRRDCCCRRLWRRLTCRQASAGEATENDTSNGNANGSIRQSRVQIIGAPNLFEHEPASYSHWGSQCLLPNSAYSSAAAATDARIVTQKTSFSEQTDATLVRADSLGTRVLHKLKNLMFFWRKRADEENSSGKKKPLTLPYWTVYIAWARVHMALLVLVSWFDLDYIRQ